MLIFLLNCTFISKVIGKELFRVLREKWGKDFDLFISEKLILVHGDITYENLGIQESNLREQMLKDIDIIVNSAATTDFYERYKSIIFVLLYNLA